MSVMRSILLAGSQSTWLRERAMRARFVRRSVARFMPGETMDEALAAARALEQRGTSTVLTHLGENLSAPAEADAVTAHYLELLQRVHDARLDAHISVKPTQLGLDLDADTCHHHLATLVERAAAIGNFVWIDMESSAYVDRTLELFRRVRAASPRVGLCLQAYLRRTASDLESLLPLGPAIRLVKGAYKEPPSLAFPDKKDVDENFYRLAARLLDEREGRRAGAMVAIGTHDERLVERLRQHPGLAGAACEFEMLYGIRTGLQARLLQERQPLRVLISYGEFWFPWYMRRLAERPANVWFVVKSTFAR